jgi:hypothetical protein
LEKQVAVVTALMRVAPDWEIFELLFNRNFRPHLPEQKNTVAVLDKKNDEAAK